jgi:hypothetical protein
MNFTSADNPVPIALNGRVPVKVSTINGPINIGDPLTTSSIPGVAMKATEAGIIIGKAQENFANPDPFVVGKIFAFTNIAWYEPGAYLANSGLLEIQGQEGNYNVTDKNTGNIASKISQFKEIVVASVRSGITTTKELLVETSANVQGTLTTVALQVTGNATIDGTLTAKNITSDNILALTDKVNAHEISIAALNTNLNALQATMNDVVGQDINTGAYYMNVAEIHTINLAVEDLAQVKRLHASESANIASISISGNTIASTLAELKFSALESISFFDGQVIIAKDGTIRTKGEVIAEKGIKTNKLTALNESEDINVNLNSNNQIPNPNSKLKINSLDKEVASIDTAGSFNTEGNINASGSAYIANGITFDKNIASVSAVIAADQTFSEIGENTASIKTNGEASGKAVIPAGTTELLIRSDKVTNESLVYVTPLSSTQNQIIYVDSKKAGAWFKVKIDQAISGDIEFSWWVL